MENDLFNLTLMKKHSKKFKLTPTKHSLLKEYINKVEKDDFKSETKNYLYFYDVILKGILGYKREDVLFDEKGDVGTGRSEFVLKSDEKKFMVIELKGQGIDLDKRQSGRADNKSPVEQAFGYAINTGDVDWIMVSNYGEFRLYNYYEKTKCISFNASELLDKQKFAYFMLAFSRESHIEFDYINKVKEGTLIVDRKLASEFYKLYNETRLMLIKELETENKMERLDAIHYAQLILNRYMFVCFAEDTNLLPPQISIDTILTPIQKGNIRHRSIWQRINELCLDINEGNDFKKINEYNGGLFAEDLDFIKIRDIVDDQSFFKDTYQNWNFTEYEKDITHLLGTAKDKINPIYCNMLIVSSFDFSTELDVNILGHIFENSIGDIEELKEDSKGRRKKEGIFYTPDYITDYICRNTIIPYLSRSGKSSTVEELIGEYWGSKIEELDKKVKDIKIVDPACGSGAFLNKAADVLLEIHQVIHQTRYKNKKDTLTPYFDSIGERREILLNNIYGVDLNEESAEITKLSLFLKVCRKGLKLPNLDKNIKCGNSIIDDPEYTDKPFNWLEEFEDIFSDGGFDVVIGNPPYVRQEKIKEIKQYLKNNYLVYHGMADLYTYFFEKGLKILKKNGIFSFITANKFTRTKNDLQLRKFILNYDFIKYNDYTGKNVFEEVTTNPAIIIIKNSFNNDNNIIINDEFSIPQKMFDEGIWSFKRPEVFQLKAKIDEKSVKLGEIEGMNIFRGVVTGFDKAFIIDETTKNTLIAEDPNSGKIIKPLARGKDLKRYNIDFKNLYLIFTKRGINIDDYGTVKEYLCQFKERLTPRNEGQKIGRKRGDYKWYEIQDTTAYYKEFSREKIIWGNLSIQSNFAYSNNELFITAPANMLTGNNIKYILPILNSKLISFYFESIGAKVDSGYLEWKKNRVELLPIYPALNEEQKPFINKTDQILELHKEVQKEVNGFKKWIIKEFDVDKLSKKLEKYYELSEEEFITEMRKKKVNTKLRRNREYLEREFNESLAIITPLLQNIEKIDNLIDQMVYKLYNLTDEEINIIEDNLS